MTKYHYYREQLVFVEFPDGSTRAAGFDNIGQQLWAVDERGVAVTNAYDSLGRLTSSEYVPLEDISGMPDDFTDLPDGCTPTTCQWSQVYGGFGQTVAFQYDEVGNELSRTDWSGTYTNAYDALGRAVLQYSFSYVPCITAQWSTASCYDMKSVLGFHHVPSRDEATVARVSM